MPDDQLAPSQPTAVADGTRGRPWLRMSLAALNCVAFQFFFVRSYFWPMSGLMANPPYFWIAIYGWFTISALFGELLERERRLRAEIAGHIAGPLAAFAFFAAVSEEPPRVTVGGIAMVLLFPVVDLGLLFFFRRSKAATAKSPIAAKTGDEPRP
jgi:hypothetical protein